METERLKTENPLPMDDNSFNASLFTFDLPTIIQKMKSTWTNGELNALILLKKPAKQIVLTALHEGTKIKSFQSYDSITFQIMEGKLKFRTRKESVTLDKGQLLTLHENIKYSLTSKEDTVFLLTIANNSLRQARI